MAYIDTEQYNLFRQIPLAPDKIKVKELCGEKYPPARVMFLLKEAARFDHKYVLAPDGVDMENEVSLTEEGLMMVKKVEKHDTIQKWSPLIMLGAIAVTAVISIWAMTGFPNWFK